MYLFICDLAWYKNYGGLRISRLNPSVNNRSKTKQKSRYLKVASTFLFGLQTDFYQIEISRVRVVWKFNLSLFIQIFR